MSETVWLKPQQVETMRDQAYNGQHGQRDDAILTLLYDTGLRRLEVSRLNVGMVDLEDGQLRIPPHIQKQYPNGKTPPPVTFELDRDDSLRTVRTLRAYMNDEEPKQALFPSRTHPRITGKGVNDVVKRLASRSGVKPYVYGGRREPSDVTAHTLRHSVAWRMLRNGENNTLYDVKNRLRHASILTTERHYDHFETV